MQISETITRKSASNLALAFVLLPKAKRAGMCALYAFCREVDDVADDESVPVEQRRRQLTDWRHDIQAAYQEAAPQFAVTKELAVIIRTYNLKYELFDELIRGVEMDLDTNRYETFSQLETYCYRVASVVGLLSIEIFGYQNHKSREYAICLGKALQLTNILRDVRKDAEMGRIYIPLEQLRAFGVSTEDILNERYTPQYRDCARWMADRAYEFYAQARLLLPEEDRTAMSTAELMGSVYWKVLMKIETQEFNVFDYPAAKLSKAQKLRLVGSIWIRQFLGMHSAPYGTA